MPSRAKFFRYDEKSDKVVQFERAVEQHRPQYPLPVEAMAVHPDQIAEARTFDRVNGVPTDYRADGTPIIEDSRHYRKYRRIHGVHDRNGFES